MSTEPNELRRGIAELLGWTFSSYIALDPYSAEYAYAVRTPDGKSHRRAYTSLMHGIPDWPGNTDAALDLCLKIARDNNWEITITPLRKSGLICADFGDGNAAVHWREGLIIAYTLSLLAYTALKALVGGEA